MIVIPGSAAAALLWASAALTAAGMVCNVVAVSHRPRVLPLLCHATTTGAMVWMISAHQVPGLAGIGLLWAATLLMLAMATLWRAARQQDPSAHRHTAAKDFIELVAMGLLAVVMPAMHGQMRASSAAVQHVHGMPALGAVGTAVFMLTAWTAGLVTVAVANRRNVQPRRRRTALGITGSGLMVIAMASMSAANA